MEELKYNIIDKKLLKSLSHKIKNMSTAMMRGLSRAVTKMDSELTASLYSGKYGIKQRHGQAGLAGSFQARYLKLGDTIQAIYGSKLVYAMIQEKGGRIKVTSKMASFAWYKYRETNEPMWRAIALRVNRRIMIPSHFYFKNTYDKNRHKMSSLIMNSIKENIKE